MWATTPKSGPAPRALTTPTAVYQGTVETTGRLTISNKYVIMLGVARAGATATTVITGTACHVFIQGHLARAVTLNPSRRYQGLRRNHQPPAR